MGRLSVRLLAKIAPDRRPGRADRLAQRFGRAMPVALLDRDRIRLDDQVLRLARLGVEAGIDGVVASSHELKKLRTEFGDKIKIVVPGVRPSWSEAGDQKRVMSPRQAIEAGADYLVIGRPIIAHTLLHRWYQ